MSGQSTNASRPSEFGVLLRRFRVAASLTQEVLAERSGMSTRAISDLERGERQAAHPINARRIADALPLTPFEREEFLGARTFASPLTAPKAPSHVHRLPVRLTPLVGRVRETMDAVGILQSPGHPGGTRLLTVTGPGGVGKTRFALHVAAEIAPAFPDGVCFVDLASIADPEVMPATVVRALGVRLADGESPGAALSRFLRERQMLLLLDNFEHLLSGAPLVADLLAACPHLCVVVTSRSRLRLRGEREFPLSPLSWSRPPDAEAPVSGAPDSNSDAVQLFVARLRDVQPAFTVTAANAAAVVEICRRLDGLPLALELVAAWGKVLSPTDLATRLEHRLPLLKAGAMDLPARQQTMAAAIAWSHDLLNPAEQSLFRRLACFAGGFTLAAAEAVCADATGPGVLDRLTTLVDWSLLRPDVPSVVDELGTPDLEPRFAMLETIREFALAELQASGETERTRQHHADYFLRRAEQTEPKLMSGEREQGLAYLDAEHDNLRAALTWALEVDPAGALRLAGALRWFWYFRSHFTEGRRWLGRALAPPPPPDSDTYRASALRAAGVLAFYQDGGLAARPHLLASAALCRARDDRAGLAHTLVPLAIAVVDDDYHLARTHLEESIGLFRDLGDEWGGAFAASYLGAISVWRVGDEPIARAALEMSQSAYRRLGDGWGLSGALYYLGIARRQQGEHLAALLCFEESLALCRAAGDTWRVTTILSTLAAMAHDAGDQRRAVALLLEAVTLAAEQGRLEKVAELLIDMAHVTAARSRPEQATRLFAAASSLCETLGIRESSLDDGYAQGVDAALGALGDNGFAAAWAAGKTLPWQRIVAQTTSAEQPLVCTS